MKLTTICQCARLIVVSNVIVVVVIVVGTVIGGIVIGIVDGTVGNTVIGSTVGGNVGTIVVALTVVIIVVVIVVFIGGIITAVVSTVVVGTVVGETSLSFFWASARAADRAAAARSASCLTALSGFFLSSSNAAFAASRIFSLAVARSSAFPVALACSFLAYAF